MFVHAVYFWLRSDLNVEDRERFVSWLPKLCTLPSVRQGYFGVPAATDRAVIDRTYSYALTLLFDDGDAEAAYQVDADHDRFREECGTFWTQVRIYDSVTP